MQSDGTYRMDDMSGDGVAGGAFMTGFTVVPYGNVVYARPDYVENPLLPSTLSNGSLANPTRCWPPRAIPTTAPASNPTHDPNGGLNSTVLPAGQLQPRVRFQRRRQVRAVGLLRGVAARPINGARSSSSPCPASPPATRSPAQVTQASFVLSRPGGQQQRRADGSASVPFDTTLVFQAGPTLEAPERVAVRAEPGQRPPGPGHRRPTR